MSTTLSAKVPGVNVVSPFGASIHPTRLRLISQPDITIFPTSSHDLVSSVSIAVTRTASLAKAESSMTAIQRARKLAEEL